MLNNALRLAVRFALRMARAAGEGNPEQKIAELLHHETRSTFRLSGLAFITQLAFLGRFVRHSLRLVQRAAPTETTPEARKLPGLSATSFDCLELVISFQRSRS